MEGERASQSFEYQQALDPSLVKHLVDFEEVIDSLRLIFKGQDIDYSTKPPTLIDFGKPMMNDFGIGRIVTKLKIIHKGIPMATLDIKTPYIYTRIMAINLAKELFRNYAAYGLVDDHGLPMLGDMEKIIELVITSLQAAFSRATKGAEKDFIKGFARENRSIGGEPKKRSLL